MATNIHWDLLQSRLGNTHLLQMTKYSIEMETPWKNKGHFLARHHLPPFLMSDLFIFFNIERQPQLIRHNFVS